jgi:hypothetical protein
MRKLGLLVWKYTIWQPRAALEIVAFQLVIAESCEDPMLLYVSAWNCPFSFYWNAIQPLTTHQLDNHWWEMLILFIFKCLAGPGWERTPGSFDFHLFFLISHHSTADPQRLTIYFLLYLTFAVIDNKDMYNFAVTWLFTSCLNWSAAIVSHLP